MDISHVRTTTLISDVIAGSSGPTVINRLGDKSPICAASAADGIAAPRQRASGRFRRREACNGRSRVCDHALWQLRRLAARVFLYQMKFRRCPPGVATVRRALC